MRYIKFRGKAFNGKYVYGDLIHTGYKPCIIAGKNTYFVKPESVAQLVGYSKEGYEIYEGDTVVSDIGNEFIARLQPQAFQPTQFNDIINLDIGSFHLKEDKNEIHTTASEN